MKQQPMRKLMPALFVALSVVLVGGLFAVPIIEKVDAQGPGSCLILPKGNICINQGQPPSGVPPPPGQPPGYPPQH
jgi:hypothetical protein